MDCKYCLIKTNLQIRKLPIYGCFFSLRHFRQANLALRFHLGKSPLLAFLCVFYKIGIFPTVELQKPTSDQSSENLHPSLWKCRKRVVTVTDQTRAL